MTPAQISDSKEPSEALNQKYQRLRDLKAALRKGVLVRIKQEARVQHDDETDDFVMVNHDDADDFVHVAKPKSSG